MSFKVFREEFKHFSCPRKERNARPNDYIKLIFAELTIRIEFNSCKTFK